jgi:hypothetical protein
MPQRDSEWTMLATRVPKGLHRRLRLYCVDKGITMIDFVTAAIEARLHPKRKLKKPPD